MREYYKIHAVDEYDVSRFYNHSLDSLTPLFYNANRAMRESGFDVSYRFGPFSAAILDYDPVDLNCLLYRMEMDTAAIYTLLDQNWEKRSNTAINPMKSGSAGRMPLSSSYMKASQPRTCPNMIIISRGQKVSGRGFSSV